MIELRRRRRRWMKLLQMMVRAIFYEDVDGELMYAAAYDVDDAHDDELVTIYDKENPIIAVGKLFPNMGEFRMCFKTCN
jgi:hypothetical protein